MWISSQPLIIPRTEIMPVAASTGAGSAIPTPTTSSTRRAHALEQVGDEQRRAVQARVHAVLVRQGQALLGERPRA